jgi:transcriptional regulator with XRE-family HTH domain
MARREEVRESVAKQLRTARTSRGETQEAVARKLGLSRQMINRYENGHDSPRPENLAGLVRYYGILLDIEGHKFGAEALETKWRRVGKPAKQLELPLDRPQEFSDARVRIIRKSNSIEIHTLVTG